MTAVALAIAGSDSGGGAGMQGDLKTFAALGVYGASVVTAITAQNTVAVTAIHPVPPEIIRAQIDAIFADFQVGATKIGMLGSHAAVTAVADALAVYRTGPVVLDPVLASSTGTALADDAVRQALLTELLPQVDLVTPNLLEAARLLDAPLAAGPKDIAAQADALRELGARAVLLKGGHAEGETAADLLATADGHVWLEAQRIPTRNTHGTGCALSSAIAAFLARGFYLAEAVRHAKAYVHSAIAAADRLQIGRGDGPVHHLHALWGERFDP